MYMTRQNLKKEARTSNLDVHDKAELKEARTLNLDVCDKADHGVLLCFGC